MEVAILEYVHADLLKPLEVDSGKSQLMCAIMAGSVGCRLEVLVVEEFLTSSSKDGWPTLVESVWGRMPQELVERVLLFLPAPSQARFRIVCKRWKELMISKAFQEQTTLISFRRGYPVCKLNLRLTGMSEAVIQPTTRLKMRTVDIPGLTWLHHESVTLLSHSGLPLVAMAVGAGQLRVALLNPAKQTWRELPVLLLGSRHWLSCDAWLVPAEGTNFRVCAQHTVVCPDGSCHTFLHALSSTPTHWRTTACRDDAQVFFQGSGFGLNRTTALISGGKYAVVSPSNDIDGAMSTVARLSGWGEGISITVTALPRPPRRHFLLLSDGRTDVVFAYGTEEDKKGLFLYKLRVNESSTSRRWERVLSQQRPPALQELVMIFVRKAHIVGNMVLLLAYAGGK